MFKVFTEVEGLRFTEVLASPWTRRCVTFIRFMDDHEEKLYHLTSAELFFDQHAVSGHNLKGMPTVLINVDGQRNNRVVVRAPNNIWVDVTHSTKEELSNISMGELDSEAAFIPTLGLSCDLSSLMSGVSLNQ